MLFETPNHTELLDKTGCRTLVFGIIDELLTLAAAQGCQFPVGFRDKIVAEMVQPTEIQSVMYQDYTAKRPMEVETYLGSPLKLAQEAGVLVPRLETLYPILHNLNIVNQTRPAQNPMSPTVVQAPPRMSSVPANGAVAGPVKNGVRPSTGRAPSMNGAPPPMRRGMSNGYPPRAGPNGYGPNGMGRGGPDGNGLEEFSHVMLYDSYAEGFEGANGVYDDSMGQGAASTGDLAIRERELQLRQRELALREREYSMRRGRGPPPPASHAGGFDDEDEDDFFDPMSSHSNYPPVDADNIDMMSVTSRRNRRGPPGRPSMDMGGGPPSSRGRNMYPRQKNRASTRAMSDMPMIGDSNIMNNPLMDYASNRYGNVDRGTIGRESRTNSLTAARLDELQRGPGAGGFGGNGGYPGLPRRSSQSPGHPLGGGPRPPGNRPSPPNGYPHMNGANGANNMNGNRPSPPNGMRQPVPRHPPGHGNAVAPHQVEQHAGVSSLQPPPPPKKGPQVVVRSLTGSASASAESGDSGASAHLGSEPSAHSSASSLAHRQHQQHQQLLGVRG